jgi:hypothetical protein
MSLSMYQACVPVLLRQLGALSKLLEAGVAHAGEQGIPEATMLELRFAPDMLPLPRQVQLATDSAKGCVARLAGIEIPSYADTEQSFAELQARIAKTIAFIETVTPEQIDGSEDRAFALKLPNREIEFLGQPFLLHFALPNFFFHVTVAYTLLRANGVKIGKVDYLGGL